MKYCQIMNYALQSAYSGRVRGGVGTRRARLDILRCFEGARELKRNENRFRSREIRSGLRDEIFSLRRISVPVAKVDREQEEEK